MLRTTVNELRERAQNAYDNPDGSVMSDSFCDFFVDEMRKALINKEHVDLGFTSLHPHKISVPDDIGKSERHDEWHIHFYPRDSFRDNLNEK